MSSPIQDKLRQVLPRLRPSSAASARGELNSIEDRKPSRPQSDQSEFRNARVKAWGSSKGLSVASDIVAAAIVSGPTPEALEAATLLLAPESRAADNLKELAARLLGRKSPSRGDNTSPTARLNLAGARIKELRSRLRDYPGNSIAWMDLALEHTIAFNQESAIHAAEVALALSPDNRHILRSSSRLFLHFGEPGRALSTLRKASASQEDPWLMAAEVAVADFTDAPPRFAKSGIRLIESGEIQPQHISELASALGTLEAKHGAHRRGRQLFRVSLERPTENAIAQAEWAARVLKLIDFEPRHLSAPGAFEAQTGQSMRKGSWSEGLTAATNWFEDEPFSVKPPIQAGYISSVALDKHPEAIRFIELGRRANPNDWLLKNNLAFSYASMDDVVKAESLLTTLEMPSESEKQRLGIWLATTGLIQFRKGQLQVGRELYMKAIAVLEGADLRKPKALASLFLAREEQRSRSDFAAPSLARAEDLCKGVEGPELTLWLERLREGLAKNQE